MFVTMTIGAGGKFYQTHSNPIWLGSKQSKTHMGSAWKWASMENDWRYNTVFFFAKNKLVIISSSSSVVFFFYYCLACENLEFRFRFPVAITELSWKAIASRRLRRVELVKVLGKGAARGGSCRGACDHPLLIAFLKQTYNRCGKRHDNLVITLTFILVPRATLTQCDTSPLRNSSCAPG